MLGQVFSFKSMQKYYEKRLYLNFLIFIINKRLVPDPRFLKAWPGSGFTDKYIILSKYCIIPCIGDETAGAAGAAEVRRRGHPGGHRVSDGEDGGERAGSVQLRRVRHRGQVRPARVVTRTQVYYLIIYTATTLVCNAAGSFHANSTTTWNRLLYV